jgi:SDR family mycofactocin-dependent oxidoreductase
MAGRLEGKVVFVTGAARGQGRSHAIQMAQEGADIIAIDICAPVNSLRYELGSTDDLAETVRQVEALDRRIVANVADVRDDEGLKQALDDGTSRLGPVDIVLANAAIIALSLDTPWGAWQDTIDVNLTGVFNTVEAAIPAMIERGAGGSIIITSSTAGLNGIGGHTRGGMAYTAAKHGVVGLMRAYANNLAKHSIRVNTVHPCGVETPMVLNSAYQEFKDVHTDFVPSKLYNALPVGLIQPSDISNAMVFLASDEGRYITGITLSVDAGFTNNR